jgi:protein-S-isoprenylcysteine O-methyltransferase Ste14
MSSDAKPVDPGVHVPPPLIYLAGLALGWMVDWLRPLPILGPIWLRVLLAVVCVLVWLGMFSAAIRVFRRERTTFVPGKPPTALATTGIYARTRNPMYVSMAVLYMGIALLMGSWWPLLLLPLVLVVVDRAVIAREERYLAQCFPQAYGEYRRRVRRWL